MSEVWEFDIRRLKSELAGQREDNAALRERAETAEAILKRVATRLDITPDSEIALLLDVRLRRYENDINPAVAAQLRTEKLKLQQQIATLTQECNNIAEITAGKYKSALERVSKIAKHRGEDLDKYKKELRELREDKERLLAELGADPEIWQGLKKASRRD